MITKTLTWVVVMVAMAAGSARAGTNCEPIVQTKCTQVQIDGDNCHDGGPYDSRGAYYGPRSMFDGTNYVVSCDAWHGYGDEYTWQAAVDSMTGSAPPPADRNSVECIVEPLGGRSYNYRCIVNIDYVFSLSHTVCTAHVRVDSTPYGDVEIVTDFYCRAWEPGNTTWR